jgi:hypothetical protein
VQLLAGSIEHVQVLPARASNISVSTIYLAKDTIVVDTYTLHPKTPTVTSCGDDSFVFIPIKWPWLTELLPFPPIGDKTGIPIKFLVPIGT